MCLERGVHWLSQARREFHQQKKIKCGERKCSKCSVTLVYRTIGPEEEANMTTRKHGCCLIDACPVFLS